MYELPCLGEVIPTKRSRAAKPLLLAYLLAVGFTAGLLVDRTPGLDRSVATVGSGRSESGGTLDAERETVEPPLWLQLFRPSRPTARALLRAGLPFLTAVDGSARELENRNLLVYLAGRSRERPQTLFQSALPFLRAVPPEGGAEQGPTPSPPTVDPSGQPSAQSGGEATERPPSPLEEEKPPVGGGQPLVGIYHTHDWESYISEFPGLQVEQSEDLKLIQSEAHDKRTIMGVGLNLAVRLKEHGVTTVYAEATHQRLGYDYAYSASRETARQILRDHPSVKILLDLHRDGAWGLDTTTVIDGDRVAQIRCIIGKNQPHWEENRAFCDRLMDRVDQMHPGIALPTRVQEDRYNQDLLPGAVLLEIGGALNRYEEADRAVTYLAEALGELIREGAYPQ